MTATTLTAGDIAIIGVNSDDPDTFSFVALRPIGSGTVIRFTDQSWNGSAFTASGTDSTITFTASADIAAGTVIPSSSGQFSGTLNLDSAGDTIYAYQGAVNAPTTRIAPARRHFMERASACPRVVDRCSRTPH